MISSRPVVMELTMLTTRNRIQCAVEALEDRNLMAVAVQLVDRGSTLRITGDTAAEWIHIHQNDSLNSLSVQWGVVSSTVAAASPPALEYTSSSIKRIVVDTRGGNDNLTYTVDGSSFSYSKNISIDMGAGNDTVMVDMGGQLFVPVGFDGGDSEGGLLPEPPYSWPSPTPLEIQSPLNLTVQGGVGNDTVDAIFGHIRAGMTFRSLGGVGNDSLSASLAGAISGRTVVVDQDGGLGNDQLAVYMNGASVESDARLSVIQRGGWGNDKISLDAYGLIQGALLVNQLGGNGTDKLRTSINSNWASTGSVQARILGEGGNDKMVVGIKRNDDVPSYVLMAEPLAEMQVIASAHGGMGKNLAWVTPNVKVYSAKIMESSWNVGSTLPIDPWPF